MRREEKTREEKRREEKVMFTYTKNYEDCILSPSSMEIS
jgi:hypothetical protein